jgi:TatD DNase family protein
MQDTYDILKKYQGHGLLHCFSGTKEMAQEFTKLGYYLAFGGALTFKNARHSVEAVQATDEKWLLTETDSPYMAPEPVRGTRNEPSNIPYIAAKMAEVKGVSLEHMAQTIEANWDRFLGEDQ